MSSIRGPAERFTFIPHNGRAKSRLVGLDLFAEHLSEGHSPNQAARLAGYTQVDGHYLVKLLCNDLGPQAR